MYVGMRMGCAGRSTEKITIVSRIPLFSRKEKQDLIRLPVPPLEQGNSASAGKIATCPTLP